MKTTAKIFLLALIIGLFSCLKYVENVQNDWLMGTLTEKEISLKDDSISSHKGIN